MPVLTRNPDAVLPRRQYADTLTLIVVTGSRLVPSTDGAHAERTNAVPSTTDNGDTQR